MSFDDKEKLSKIEDLKSKLFSRNYVPKTEHYDAYSHKASSVPDSWLQEKKEMHQIPVKTSIFKKFFIFSLIFFAFSVLYVLFSFVGGGNSVSNDNIEISVLGNAFANGGEELPLIVEIANKNKTALELVDLVLVSPRSTNAGANNLERQRVSIGTVPAGGVRSENVILRLFGEQGSIQSIKITVEYRVPGSNAIFVKDKFYDVTIESTPVNLLVEAPDEISPNQDIALKIKASVNSQERSERMLIKVDYPAGFQFSSSIPSPNLNNNIFELDNPEPGIEYQIAIKGRMVDVWDGDEKTFKIWSGSQSTQDKSDIDVVFSSLAHVVRINKPFIEANIFVGGSYSSEYASPSGSVITGEVRWVNNLDTKVNDMQIRLKLSGNALDRKSIKVPRGFYDSSIDTIIWDKNSDASFAEVDPGDSGLVSFSLLPKQLYSSSDGILNQPVIDLQASISGKQALSGNVSKKIESNDDKTVKIISNVGFSNQVFYYGGPFVNTGPIPPKVETETTYTVVWNLSNTSNTIRNTKIRATLPPWVNFIGTINPADANVTYNSNTKEVVWDIGTISKGAGFGNDSPKVSFQIVFKPSLSQLDDTPDLINDTILTGRDDFANVDIRINKPPLNTKLSGDTSFDAKKARVVE